MAKQVITVHLQLGPVESGLWCDVHALPHLFRVEVLALTPWGVDCVDVHEACDMTRAEEDDE